MQSVAMNRGASDGGEKLARQNDNGSISGTMMKQVKKESKSMTPQKKKQRRDEKHSASINVASASEAQLHS